MTYISKPQSRESIVIYGDGDEAIFGFVAISSKEGYMLFHIKPTNKMRWRKQIQETPEDGYDLYDGWWKKIYPKELCLQLSFDPDFPMWLILSDWEGNEHTPLFDYFIKLKPLIDRNRDLERKANNLSIALNFKRAEERKRAMHGDEKDIEFEQRVARMKKAFATTEVITIPKEDEQQL